MHRINVTDKISKQNNNNKTVGEKHAYVQGWATVEVKDGKEGYQHNITEMWQVHETKHAESVRLHAAKGRLVAYAAPVKSTA